MADLTGRLKREMQTLMCMARIYCADHHPAAARPSFDLCEDCLALMEYAHRRLEKCPYQQNKPTCQNCPIHCYRKTQREQVREVMRYAGPRMAWRHPLKALTHLYDQFRRVEHPLKIRQRATDSPPSVRAVDPPEDPHRQSHPPR